MASLTLTQMPLNSGVSEMVSSADHVVNGSLTAVAGLNARLTIDAHMEATGTLPAGPVFCGAFLLARAENGDQLWQGTSGATIAQINEPIAQINEPIPDHPIQTPPVNTVRPSLPSPPINDVFDTQSRVFLYRERNGDEVWSIDNGNIIIIRSADGNLRYGESENPLSYDHGRNFDGAVLQTEPEDPFLPWDNLESIQHLPNGYRIFKFGDGTHLVLAGDGSLVSDHENIPQQPIPQPQPMEDYNDIIYRDELGLQNLEFEDQDFEQMWEAQFPPAY